MYGGHQLYYIPTGKLITRHGKLHVIPTLQHIVNKINALGNLQNGSILKIESKYFPTWSAAVDDCHNDDNQARHNDDNQAQGEDPEQTEDQEQNTYDSEESDSDSDSDDEEEGDDDNTLDTDDSTVPEDSDASDDEQPGPNVEEQDQAPV